MSSPAAAAAGAQLDWEARKGKLAAGAAFLSAALAAASVAIQLAVIGGPPGNDRDRETLIRFDEHRSDFFLSLGMQIVSYFLLAGALFYLLRATMHRRPETPRFAVGLLLLAPLLLAVGGVLNQIDLNDLADQFLASEEPSEDLAEKLLEDRGVVGGAIGLGGVLCLALSLVLISLNAMRAGLLSRFMGVLGTIVGVLLILPLFPLPVVQVFWLGALGVLFLDWWPNGRSPAWETGEAVPWPSAAEARAAAAGEAPEADPRDDAAQREEPTPPATAHPASRKRKKKRR